MKTVARDQIDAGSLEWMSWEEDRTLPFSLRGAKGKAWVKILSWDPDTGAESLVYRLEPGWSAPRLENTVSEDLVVWEGELQVGDQTLGKYGYAYRPIGSTTGPCASPLGATIVSFCRGPNDTRGSTVPIPALDDESRPWLSFPTSSGRLWKPLRADEETLDVYRLFRVPAGSRTEKIESEYGLGGIEELFTLRGKVRGWYEAWPRRVIPLISGAGRYVYHGTADHGRNETIEDVVTFKHDAYLYDEKVKPEARQSILDMFENETPAVKALKEGRDPQLAGP
jgi:hypothetical protein